MPKNFHRQSTNINIFLLKIPNFNFNPSPSIKIIKISWKKLSSLIGQWAIWTPTHSLTGRIMMWGPRPFPGEFLTQRMRDSRETFIIIYHCMIHNWWRNYPKSRKQVLSREYSHNFHSIAINTVVVKLMNSKYYI